MTKKRDRIYGVNIKRLSLLTLPIWLRHPLCGALIYAGTAPLGRLLQELRVCRKSTNYRLGHNGQVCKLRGVLNDEFDPEERRIRIEESDGPDNGDSTMAWCRDAGRWVILPRRGLGAMTIYREGYGGTEGYDFWISVPDELRSTEKETRLRAVANMYKLAAKRYAINYK